MFQDSLAIDNSESQWSLNAQNGVLLKINGWKVSKWLGRCEDEKTRKSRYNCTETADIRFTLKTPRAKDCVLSEHLALIAYRFWQVAAYRIWWTFPLSDRNLYHRSGWIIIDGLSNSRSLDNSYSLHISGELSMFYYCIYSHSSSSYEFNDESHTFTKKVFDL